MRPLWDNTPTENFFGHIKEEGFRRINNSTFKQAQQIIDDYYHRRLCLLLQL